MDVLVLTDRVKNVIALHESHFREFKSCFEGSPGSKKPRKWPSVARDIAEALVAFANADGGDLLVGVEDDGQITGVPHDQRDIARLLAAPREGVKGDRSLPLQVSTELQIDGQTILFFSVLKGNAGVYQLTDGRCVRRAGTSTVPEVAEKILFDQREAASRAFDNEYVDGASVPDLDAVLLGGIADRYLRGITPEKFLQQVGLAEFASGGLRLRRAALLLFASDIRRWHPRSQVRILKVAGTTLRSGNDYNVTSDESITGNIFELLVRGWEELRPYLAYKTELGVDAGFEQKYIYPEFACREALINALTHRDYSSSNGVDVFIYDDRMEFRNPGAILSTLSIDELTKLTGVHESRNAIIARVLREARYVRELGEGMKRIFELMENSALRTPALRSEEHVFTVTLYHQSVFSTQQLSWLEMFEMDNLSPLQQRILVAGMDSRELSPSDTYQAMNTTDRDTYDREVTALRKRGVLQETRTNPQATAYARKRGVEKANIGRYVVTLPGTNSPAALPDRRGPKPNNVERKLKLAVFGIPSDATESELIGVFSHFGRVVDVRIPPQEGSALSYGFIELSGVRDALEVLGASFALNGRPLRVEAAKRK